MYQYTISRLDRLASRRKKGHAGRGNQGLLKAVAEQTGVPHRTIQKLTSREIRNPTIRTLQPLYNFVIEFDREIRDLDKSLTEIQKRRISDDSA